jgi:hypothetical protein
MSNMLVDHGYIAGLRADLQSVHTALQDNYDTKSAANNAFMEISTGHAKEAAIESSVQDKQVFDKGQEVVHLTDTALGNHSEKVAHQDITNAGHLGYGA